MEGEAVAAHGKDVVGGDLGDQIQHLYDALPDAFGIPTGQSSPRDVLSLQAPGEGIVPAQAGVEGGDALELRGAEGSVQYGQEVDVACRFLEVVESQGAVDVEADDVIAEGGQQAVAKGLEERDDGRWQVSQAARSTEAHDHSSLRLSASFREPWRYPARSSVT